MAAICQTSSYFSRGRTAGAGDEDLHQPPGALLPVGVGRDMGDSDQGAQQVEGIDVAANVTVFDGALYQRCMRCLHLAAGTLKQLGRISRKRAQHGSDELLGRNEVNEPEHPRAQRLDRGQSRRELPSRGDELIHFTAIYRLDQGIPGGEVTIECSRPYARLLGHVIQAGIGAIAGECLLGRIQNAFTVPLCIGARFALGGR